MNKRSERERERERERDRETETETERRKHCALAVTRQSQKIFAPPQTPFPGDAGRPKFNQLEMVTTFTYKPSSVRIVHAISSYRGNRPTNTQTNPHPHT